jgi:hypothetical protein
MLEKISIDRARPPSFYSLGKYSSLEIIGIGRNFSCDYWARLESYSFVQTMRNSFVQQIDPAKDALRMEEVVKLFGMAFAQVCALKEV